MEQKSNSKSYIFVIDVGTQSIRAALIDLEGNICEIERTLIEPYFSDQPGYAEQDPEYFWTSLCKTTKTLFKNSSIDTSNIKGAAITTQRGTVINLDKDGKPLRPAIIWLDQRKAKVTDWPKGITKKGLQLINMYESITFAIKEGEVNWIRQNQPEIWKKTNKFLLLSGFFLHRLSGKYVDSIGSIVGFLPFNYKLHEYSKPGAINSRMFPMDQQKLADLVF